MNSNQTFKIIKASAGTGKTYNLVQNYIQFVLPNPENFYHTLGLTFTKKAAAEMKDRIIKKIMEINNPSDFVNDFGDVLLIKKNANEILSSILFNYSRFDFQTLDSFFYKINKVFSKDLGIPPNFQTELDIDFFINQCIQQLFLETNNNEELRRILLDFLMFRFENDDTWNLDIPLIELTNEILKDSSQVYLDYFLDKKYEHFKSIENCHLKFINEYEQKVISTIDNLKNKNNLGELLNKNDIWFNGSRGLPSKIKKLENLKELNFEDIQSILLFLSEKKYFKDENKNQYQNYSEIIYETYIKLNRIFEFNDWKKYITHLFAYRSIKISTLVSKILEITNKIKLENQLILVSDFNTKIKEFLKNEPPEYLYWRLGNRYFYFLLDEFQDTSKNQFENLKPLIETVITTHENFGILVVGDVKQSIYRWRGSEPSLLQNLHKDNVFQPVCKVIKLDTNYRSSTTIVEFVNEFFQVISKKISHDIIQEFSNLNQKAQNKDVGYVKIEKIENKNSKNEINNTILEKLLNEIQNLINYDCSIAILVRTNSESRKIAQFLSKNNISFSASESLLMSNSVVIQFLYEVLKIIHFPQNQLSLLTAQNLSNYLDIEWNINKIDVLRDTLRSYSLYEQTEHLINYFNLYSRFDSQIAHFLNFIHNYENLDYNKNLNFWEWFDRYSMKESLNFDSKEQIKILTVHQSKGLEFDVVMCPFLNWDLYPKNGSKYWGIYNEMAYLLNYQKKQEHTLFLSFSNENAFQKETIENIVENTNLLYVALTRAKYRFYGCFIEPKNNDKINKISHYFKDFFEQFQCNNIYTLGCSKILFNQKINHPFNSVEKIELNYYPLREKLLLKPIENEEWDLLIEKNEARKKGIIVHKILEKIKYINDLEQLIDDFISQGKIELKDKNSIIKKLEGIFEIPLVNLWFSENVFVLKEQKFIQKNQESKIPDRMVIHKNILYIIDFKTGQKYHEHKSQLEDYANVIEKSNLKSIKNFDCIKKFIVYIDTNEVIEV